jgi:Tfp pilus assembly protein PilO
LKALQQKSSQLAQAVNNYNSIPDETKLKLFTLLPNTPNPTCLIDGLNGLINSNQVQSAGLQFQPFDLKGNSKCVLDNTDLPIIEKNSQTASALKEVPFAVNLTSGYTQLTNFLNSLNSSIRLIRIDSALISKTSEAPEVLSISGKAYYYK